MIQIQPVELGPAGIVFPADKVGIVIAQPDVHLSQVEPFRWPDAARPEALATIRRTLAISREASHGLEKTHFTVLPEYSIPGIEGVQVVEAELASAEWPSATVVIGGVHALTVDEYSEILSWPSSHFDATCNGVAAVGNQEWLNCAVTWIKSSTGQVQRWVQPKLFPSWPEMNISYQAMFRGGSVFMFQGPRLDGTTYRFATVVCFDWIATIGQRKTLDWILNALHEGAPTGAEVALSWLFVIQRNPKPSHDSFLKEVEPFFNQTLYPRVRREDACVVFANGSGRSGLGSAEEFGATSLIFSHAARFPPSDCPATFSNGGRRYRGSTLLSSYRDVYFRERGTCILSFAQVNPRSLPAGPAGRALPLEHAFVYATSGPAEPRAPGGPVPGCIKWLQDELDDARGVSGYHPHAPLATAAAAMCSTQIALLRQLGPQEAAAAIDLAAAALASRKSNGNLRSSDEWDHNEEEAMEHVLSTMNILGLGRDLNLVLPSAHATLQSAGAVLDLLAVRGASHEACVEHVKRFQMGSARQILLVSRDADNSPWDRAFGSILQAGDAAVGDEVSITEPDASVLHVSYQQLLTSFLHAAAIDELAGGIDAQLAA